MNPVFEGSVVPESNGVLKCSGLCTIYSDLNLGSSGSAFAFSVISVDDSTLPQIFFGIRDHESEVLSLNYFNFLSTQRQATPSLPISIDGLGCTIRMIVDLGILTVYVADHPVFEGKVTSNGQFFVKVVDGKCTILSPFNVSNEESSWFPALQPLQWKILENSILIRRFHMRKIQSGDPGMTWGGTQRALRPIPGTNIIYFEVICNYVQSKGERSSSAIAIGITSSTIDNMIAFHTKDGTIRVGSSTTQTSFPPVLMGDVIGIGIDADTGRVFATLNGVVAESEYTAENIGDVVAMVGLLAQTDECTVNFGQLPFAYKKLMPPKGWCLYEPKVSDLWARGPRSYGHIEGYYRELGAPHVEETMLARDPLNDKDCIELTIQRMTLSKSISIGVGFPECANGKMAGLEKGCLGFNSDGISYDGENHKTERFDRKLITENKTIGITKSGETFELTVNNESFPIETHQESLQWYPMLTVKNTTLHGILNNGQFPFVKDAIDQEGDVELFNHVSVRMTEAGLDEFGLMKGDIVESRDRVFFGKVVGMFNGRPFFNVPGIRGAVCLDSADPIYHKMLLRIVSRPRAPECWTPVLILNGVTYVNIGSSLKLRPMTILCCEFGASIFIGSTKSGKPVIRLPNDVISSANAVILNNTDAQITEMAVTPTGGRFSCECDWFHPSASFYPLDIVSIESLCTVIGYSNGKTLAFDGHRVIDVPDSARLHFRFFGYDNGTVFWQNLLSSSCAASYVTSGVFTFANDICGVYGCHTIHHQNDKLHTRNWRLVPTLPPYIAKTLANLCKEHTPMLTHVKLGHVELDDVFYDCEIPEDAVRVSEHTGKPGLIIHI